MAEVLGIKVNNLICNLVVAIIAVLLLVFFKGRRKIFVIPAIILGLMIDNPLSKTIWEEVLKLPYYWRVLWIVPVIPLCACLAPMITEKVHSSNLKGAIAILSVCIILLTGSYMYTQEHCVFFVPADNPAKLPQHAVDIADKLLLLDDHPRIVTVPSVGVYIRQYSSDIESLFGRDIYGYIKPAKEDAHRVNEELNDENGDYAIILEIMLKGQYDFLVIPDNWEYARQEIEKLGFYCCSDVTGYAIYKTPITTIKETDKYGRIVSATYIDSDGTIVNGPDGYAKIEYGYDEGSNIINRKLTDLEQEEMNGRPEGCYGMEETYTSEGRLASRWYLDNDGNLMMCKDGYARVSWEVDERGSQYIAFYDDNNQPVALEGKNIVRGVDNDWSSWMSPEQGSENICFNIGEYALGKTHAGDIYTCQIEIEFSDVKECEGLPFGFRTQGAVDGGWDIGNIWNSLVYLEVPPENGVYRYTASMEINESMAGASWFNIGFRCDNWASGRFRVKGVKIEKGESTTVWSPGL